MTTHLAVGRAVQAGEVLAALDAAAPRLQHEEARVQLAALTAQRQARQQEIRAEQVAQQDERQASRVALDEARARHREADVAARAAAEQAAIYARLDARGLASRLDLLRTRADADQKRAAAEALRLAVSRLESDQRTKDSDRTARLTQFHREVTRLDGDIRTAEATLARLSHTLDQTQVRAPITGTLGEVATLQPGAVVRPGDTWAWSSLLARCGWWRTFSRPPPWAGCSPGSRHGCGWTVFHGHNTGRWPRPSPAWPRKRVMG